MRRERLYIRRAYAVVNNEMILKQPNFSIICLTQGVDEWKALYFLSYFKASIYTLGTQSAYNERIVQARFVESLPS